MCDFTSLPLSRQGTGGHSHDILPRPACLPACLRACLPACLPACLAAGLPAGLPFLLPVSRKRRAEEGERVKGQDGTKQQRQWRQDESCFVLCTQRYLICQRDKQEEGRGDSIEQRPSPGQTRNTAAAAAAAAAAASHLCTNMCRTCEE